jgi:2-keto-3-deoxy-L-fuconate dehydrogenase
MNRLAQKRALITGAGAGIGRETAIKFANENAYVIATDINPHSLVGLEVHGVGELTTLDVTDTATVKALSDKIGRVDVLFNCAAIVHHGTVLEASESDWDRSFDVNVKSIHRVISAFLPGMLEAGSGSIINVASAASSVRGIPNRYIYGATKAAVIGLTKAVAADFIKQGIRCNAICPGTIQSPSLEGRIADQAAKQERPVEEIRQAFVDRQPMGRLGTPEEIAWLAVYLASDESKYTTGQIHIADGGFAL